MLSHVSASYVGTAWRVGAQGAPGGDLYSVETESPWPCKAARSVCHGRVAHLIRMGNTIDDPMAKLHNHYGEIVGVQGVALGATVRSEDIPEFHNGNSFGLDGSELGTFEVGPGPYSVLFDGESIWVTKDGGDTISKLAR